MDWYIVILVMLLFNVAVEQRVKRSRKSIATVALQSSCFILLLFMALRSQSVGADTSGYCRVFVQGYSGEKMEKGYLLFNKILRLFSANPQTITVANSLLLIFLLYQSVKKLSPIPQLSIWLYVTLGVFQTEMNLTRNAIAIMMCYLATQYIPQKQPLKYCACILLASSFHLTSLLFLPLYWLVRHVHLDRKKMILLVLAVVIVPVFIRSITLYIYIYIPVRYRSYLFGALNGKSVDGEKLLVELFILGLTLAAILGANKSEKPKIIKAADELPVGSWMLAVSLLLSAFAAYGTRVSALFSFYAIIFIPQIIDLMAASRIRRNNLIIIISALSLIQYIVRMSINNIGSTMPYYFFWQ